MLAVLVILVLLAPACQRRSQQTDQAPELVAALTVEPQPAAVGEANVVVEIQQADGEPVEGASVQVRGDMTHAGMAPVLAEADELAPGIYHVPFEWTMGGDWIVTITASLKDGRRLERTFELSVASEQTMDMPMEETPSQ